jgi:hypothetical protein
MKGPGITTVMHIAFPPFDVLRQKKEGTKETVPSV